METAKVVQPPDWWLLEQRFLAAGQWVVISVHLLITAVQRRHADEL